MFLIVALIVLMAFMRLPSNQIGGTPDTLCRADITYGRRFNSKLYRSESNTSPIKVNGKTPEDYTYPLNGFLLSSRPKDKSIVLPDYQTWLLTQNPLYLKPIDRANRRILDRGGQLEAVDLPSVYKPPPENSERAFRKLLGPEVQMLPQPEYLGYLPANFNIADEKQVSMNELNYINPTERLKAWELTQFKSV